MRLLGVATEPEEADELVGLGAPVSLGANRTRAGTAPRRGTRCGRARLRARPDRFAHRELGEQQRRLERSAEPSARARRWRAAATRRRRGFAPCPCSATKPPIAFISVDLARAVGADEADDLVVADSKLTSSTATSPPKRTLMPDTSSAGRPRRSAAAAERDEHRRRRRGRRSVDRALRARCRPGEQRVAGRVPDLHEPAGEIEQQDQQADARGEQRHERVVGEERRQPDDPQRAEHRPHADRCRRSPPSTRAASESSTRKKRSVNGTASTAPASSAPPNPAMHPASAKARSFDRSAPTVYAPPGRRCRGRRWWCGRCRTGGAAPTIITATTSTASTT